MRMLLKWTVPVEKGNEAIKDGTMASTIEGLTQELKPEAAYFMADEGKRAAMLIFDMTDLAQIPQIAERLFINLEAEVKFSPVMSADDLKRGLGKA